MSRLWRYGSPYTRVRDYIQNKFIAEENRPIWFDVWTVHPPFREPVLKEKLPINDYFIRNRSIREPKELNYLADKSRAAFRTSYTDSIISLDPAIAKVELPLSEKIARRVATLAPFAQEYKFDAYKAALVEAGIESDDYYRHEFLDNMADGELSTAEKTRLDRRKQQSEMELSMLQSMMESSSMQNYSIPDLDESIRRVFNFDFIQTSIFLIKQAKGQVFCLKSRQVTRQNLRQISRTGSKNRRQVT